MTSCYTLQKLSRLGRILSNIAFIFSVIGFCGCVAGLLSLRFGSGSLIKIGGVILHGLIRNDSGDNLKSIAGALSGWLIVCAGEAVLAKFAECYFKNELKAETPFTLAGARELLRLGILTLAIPTGCAVIGGIAERFVVGFPEVEKAASHFGGEAGIVLGIMFILGSLLCRYGAELKGNRENGNGNEGGKFHAEN